MKKIKVYTPEDVLFAFTETKEGEMLWNRRQTLSYFEDSITTNMLAAEEHEDDEAAERLYNLLNAVSKEYKEACNQFSTRMEKFFNEDCEQCFIDD